MSYKLIYWLLMSLPEPDKQLLFSVSCFHNCPLICMYLNKILKTINIFTNIIKGNNFTSVRRLFFLSSIRDKVRHNTTFEELCFLLAFIPLFNK